MLMSPAARRSVVGSIGFDANAEESKSPAGRAKAGRRSSTQAPSLQIKQPVNQTIDEDFNADQPTPNKRRSRRLKDDPIIEEDDEQVTLNPTINQSNNVSNNQSNGDSLATQAELEADGPPPHPATNGWGGTGNQTNNQTSTNSNAPQPAFGRRQRAVNQSINQSKDDDVVADLAEIPDVEAEIQEDLTTQVAESNHLRSHVVPALTELDAQLQNPRLSVSPNASINQTINQTFDSREIDLSLLFSCLTAPSIVYESQNVWDFDTLLSEVQSEMYAEGEGSEEEKDDVDADQTSKPEQTAKPTTTQPKASPRRQAPKVAA